jgi:hypothetical protein
MNSFKQSESEISFYQIFIFFKCNLLKIILGAFISSALGVCFFVLKPKEYKAEAYVELAKIINISPVDKNKIVEESKLPGYFSSEVLLSCDSSNTGLVKNLVILPLKTIDGLQIIFKDKNPIVVENCLLNVIDYLRNYESDYYNRILSDKKKYLISLDLRIFELNNELRNNTYSDKNLSHLFLLDIILDKITLERNNLELSLQPPQTNDFKIIGTLRVSKSEINLINIGIGSAFIGILLVIVVLIIRRYFSEILS